MEDPEVQRILQEKMKRMTSEVPKPPETIVKLTEANFEQVSNGGKPLLVDFWAAWCGPCKMMEPAIERLAAKYSENIAFGKVNVDEEMNLSSKFQVFSIPTFILFKNGNPVDTVIGAVGEGALEQFLKRALTGPTVYK
ncbi:MAG: thioredoxin [Thaumarchaeota archaeon]|nr:thioredoxin [Nitrososphaerota archaeon]